MSQAAKASMHQGRPSVGEPHRFLSVPVLPETARQASTRHKQALTLALLLLAGCAGPAGTPTGLLAGQGCDLPAGTRELAAEFERLRAVQGHFQGGSWIDDVDAWMGRKHQVMIELGSRLGGRGCTQAQVTDLLGPPDQVAGPGDAAFDQVSHLADFQKPPGEAYELLVYDWRGAHDFLYFTSEGGTILGSGWWHAYD